MSVIGTIASVGGSLLSGFLGYKGAEQAADATAAAAQISAETAKEMYYQGRTDLAPYAAVGQPAINALLGTPAVYGATPDQVVYLQDQKAELERQLEEARLGEPVYGTKTIRRPGPGYYSPGPDAPDKYVYEEKEALIRRKPPDQQAINALMQQINDMDARIQQAQAVLGEVVQEATPGMLEQYPELPPFPKLEPYPTTAAPAGELAIPGKPSTSLTGAIAGAMPIGPATMPGKPSTSLTGAIAGQIAAPITPTTLPVMPTAPAPLPMPETAPYPTGRPMPETPPAREYPQIPAAPTAPAYPELAPPPAFDFGEGGGEAPANALLSFGPEAYEESKAYKWQLDKAQEAVERMAAARGYRLSPRAAEEFMTEAQGLAQEDYYRWMNSQFMKADLALTAWKEGRTAAIEDWALPYQMSVQDWERARSSAIQDWDLQTKADQETYQRELQKWQIERAAELGDWETLRQSGIEDWLLQRTAQLGDWETALKEWQIVRGTTLDDWLTKRQTQITDWQTEATAKTSDWTNQFNAMLAQTGIGQSAAAGQAAQAGQLGNQLANLAMMTGQAESDKYIQQANALSQMISSGVNNILLYDILNKDKPTTPTTPGSNLQYPWLATNMP